MKPIATGVVAALLLTGAAVPVAAQSIDDMVACAAIARDAERLACYDAKVAATSPAARAAAERRKVESARIRAEEAAAAEAAAKAAAEARRAAKRADFGAEGIESRGAERFQPDPDVVQEVDTVINEVLTTRQGISVFLLANGQLWKQVDTFNPRVKNGDKVKLSRAPLGGYRLNLLRSGLFITVKRVK